MSLAFVADDTYAKHDGAGQESHLLCSKCGHDNFLVLKTARIALKKYGDVVEKYSVNDTEKVLKCAMCGHIEKIFGKYTKEKLEGIDVYEQKTENLQRKMVKLECWSIPDWDTYRALSGRMQESK